MKKELDIGIEFDIKKEVFDFKKEFDIKNKPITSL